MAKIHVHGPAHAIKLIIVLYKLHINLVNSEEHGITVKTVRNVQSTCPWAGQYKKCVQNDFKFIPVQSVLTN